MKGGLPDARMTKAGIRLRYAWVLRIPADDFDALRADRSFRRDRTTDAERYGGAWKRALRA